MYLDIHLSKRVIFYWTDGIDVLNWWLNSGLELKYSDNVADKALAKNRTNVLNWWLDADLFEKIDQSIN